MNLQTPIIPGDAVGALVNLELLATHTVGAIELVYWRDAKSGRVPLSAHPVSKRDELVPHRGSLGDVLEQQLLPKPPNAAFGLENLVQLKIRGDAYTGRFTGGLTMRESPSVRICVSSRKTSALTAIKPRFQPY